MQITPYAFNICGQSNSATLVRSCGKWIQARTTRPPSRPAGAPGLATPGDYELRSDSTRAARKFRSAVLVRSCTRWVPMTSSHWQQSRDRQNVESFRPREECVVVMEVGP